MPFIQERTITTSENLGSFGLRLRIHRILQSAVRIPLAFFALPPMCLSRILQVDKWPILLVLFCFWIPMLTLTYLPILWQRNADYLAHIDDTTMIGPLLDIADLTMRDRLNRTLNVSQSLSRRSRKQKLNHHAWGEHLVLRRLPLLLDRIHGGDMPPITQRQRTTLRWLIDAPEYYNYFTQPGLSDKIDGILSNELPRSKLRGIV